MDEEACWWAVWIEAGLKFWRNRSVSWNGIVDGEGRITIVYPNRQDRVWYHDDTCRPWGLSRIEHRKNSGG